MHPIASLFLFLAFSVPLGAQALPDDLIRTHLETGTALEKVRVQARAAVVQEPFETEAEWRLRQTLAADDASGKELSAWVAADAALRGAEFSTAPGMVTVKSTAAKTKGRTTVTVASKDPMVPFQQSLELNMAAIAVGSPTARILYAVQPASSGRFRTIARGLELTGGALEAPVVVPVLAFWDFAPPARNKPAKANLIDAVSVAGGGTVWLHNSGNGDKTLQLKKGFFLQRTPVTQDLYFQVTGSNPSQFAGTGELWQRPVERVNRNQARWFCNLLSQAEGLEPVYSFAAEATLATASEANFRGANFNKNGWRLPLGDEYWYAAAGGKETKNYTFIGGEDPDRIAWWPVNAGGTTHPVGQKLANELGLYDMGGNVVEWIEGPGDPIAGGTSWAQSYGLGSGAMPHLFADQSEFGHDDDKQGDLGFRVARNLPGGK